MRILSPGLLLGVCLLTLTPASADLLNDARSLLNKGKPSQAISKVNIYLKEQPRDPNGRFLKGFVLQQLGNTDAAAKIYRSLTKDFPALPEPHNNLATIYANKGDIEKAKSSLLSALKTNPEYSKIYTNLSEIYAKQASEAYQQALGIDKRDKNTSSIRISSFSKLSLPESNNTNTAATKKQPIVVSTEKAVKAPTAIAEPLLSTKEIDKIKLTVSSWANAWSSQNTENYLSYYATFFKPKSGSITEWKKQRNLRLSKPKFIRISLSDITLKPLAKDRVKVALIQRYQSNTYNDVSNKRLYLNRNAAGEWKIYRENSI